MHFFPPSTQPNKAEDVVNSTTKYIPAVMLDRREDVSSTTYPFKLQIHICMYVCIVHVLVQ